MGRKTLQLNFGGDYIAHLFLQFVYRQSAVQNYKIIRLYHLVVAIQNARLKQPKTFRPVVGEPQVHARFVVFQLWPTAQDALYRHVQRRAKIERNVWYRRETIKVAQPFLRTTARSVTRKRGVNITVRQYQVVALQQRHDLPLATICKIRS